MARFFSAAIAEILLENEVFERLLRRFDGLCGRGRAGQLVDRCLLIIDLGVKRIALLRQIVDGTLKIINDGFRITFCLFSLFDFISDFENISLLAGFENIVVSSVRLDGLRQYEGQSIAQIAEQQGKDPFTCLFDLLQAAHCDVTMIDFIAAEDDICDILRDAHSCVISDSTYPTTGMLHPRVYGTYTTLLEHFVREKQVLSLEAAVHKVTGRPAAVMGLRTKGVLAQGMDADINIFDPAQIYTRATYQDPAQFSDGLDTVFVSGQPAILHGALTGRKDGTVLTR